MEPYANGTMIEWLDDQGNIIAVAEIKAHRRIKHPAYTNAFGPYWYYIVGEHFGTWKSSKRIRLAS